MINKEALKRKRMALMALPKYLPICDYEKLTLYKLFFDEETTYEILEEIKIKYGEIEQGVIYKKVLEVPRLGPSFLDTGRNGESFCEVIDYQMVDDSKEKLGRNEVERAICGGPSYHDYIVDIRWFPRLYMILDELIVQKPITGMKVMELSKLGLYIKTMVEEDRKINNQDNILKLRDAEKTITPLTLRLLLLSLKTAVSSQIMTEKQLSIFENPNISRTIPFSEIAEFNKYIEVARINGNIWYDNQIEQFFGENDEQNRKILRYEQK